MRLIKQLKTVKNFKYLNLSIISLALIIFLIPIVVNFKQQQKSQATLGPTITLSENTSYPAGNFSITINGSGFEIDKTTPLLQNSKQISSGGMHNCAISNDDQIYCWGNNQDLFSGGNGGQLGNGSTENQAYPTKISNPTGIDSWQSISSGVFHTCAIADNNQVYCWGANSFGQLGDQTTDNQLSPKLVTRPSGVNSWQFISAGGTHTCAIADNNQAYCWGVNHNPNDGNPSGQLGNGLPDDQPIPTQVSNPIGVSSWQFISAGGTHTCAIADNNQAYCWGYNEYGQLGNNTTENQLSPTLVINSSGVTSWKNVSTGFNNTCGIANNDQLYCWGMGGVNGDNTEDDRLTPVQVVNPSGIGSWKSATIFNEHACAIADNNQVYCWGYLIGNGSEDELFVPTQVSNPLGVGSWLQVSVGFEHSCAIANDNKTYCWGDNEYGQLGNGEFDDDSVLEPTLIAFEIVEQIKPTVKFGDVTVDPNNVTYVSDSELEVVVPAHSVGMVNITITNLNGSNNSRVYPDMFEYIEYVPPETTTAPPVLTSISDNSDTYLGGKTITVIGSNFTGQKYKQISAGTDGNCALTDDDQIHCWGRNNYNQLGNNIANDRSVPMRIINPDDVYYWKQVSTRKFNSCAIADNNQIYYWGIDIVDPLEDIVARVGHLKN